MGEKVLVNAGPRMVFLRGENSMWIHVCGGRVGDMQGWRQHIRCSQNKAVQGCILRQKHGRREKMHSKSSINLTFASMMGKLRQGGSNVRCRDKSEARRRRIFKVCEKAVGAGTRVDEETAGE
jgi:hypothetical protein